MILAHWIPFMFLLTCSFCYFPAPSLFNSSFSRVYCNIRLYWTARQSGTVQTLSNLLGNHGCSHVWDRMLQCWISDCMRFCLTFHTCLQGTALQHWDSITFIGKLVILPVSLQHLIDFSVCKTVFVSPMDSLPPHIPQVLTLLSPRYFLVFLYSCLDILFTEIL